jgi:hypothetical protein
MLVALKLSWEMVELCSNPIPLTVSSGGR